MRGPRHIIHAMVGVLLVGCASPAAVRRVVIVAEEKPSSNPVARNVALCTVECARISPRPREKIAGCYYALGSAALGFKGSDKLYVCRFEAR